MTYKSSSSAETKKFAERLARRELKKAKHGRHALVFALEGDLGSGKTTFTQGFFKGLGLKKRVMSPTFILMRRSALRHKIYKNVFHVDAYRIKNAKELKPLRFKEILANPENIVLIEWADRIKNVLPKKSIWMRFSHRKNEREREIRI